MLHLANVYRPYNAASVEPQHVYVIADARPDLSPIPEAPSLESVRAKLREMGAVP